MRIVPAPKWWILWAISCNYLEQIHLSCSDYIRNKYYFYTNCYQNIRLTYYIRKLLVVLQNNMFCGKKCIQYRLHTNGMYNNWLCFYYIARWLFSARVLVYLETSDSYYYSKNNYIKYYWNIGVRQSSVHRTHLFLHLF